MHYAIMWGMSFVGDELNSACEDLFTKFTDHNLLRWCFVNLGVIMNFFKCALFLYKKIFVQISWIYYTIITIYYTIIIIR